MERSAKGIGFRKWQKLSSPQKHTAIAQFICQCIDKGYDYGSFISFYEKVMAWNDLDRYKPPSWLNDKERLENFFLFHQGFSKKPIHYYKKPLGGDDQVAWNPQLDVSVVLDQVITPYNVGSVLRVVDNFGFCEVIIYNPKLDLKHSKLKRSARGAENWVPVRQENNLIDFIKRSDKPIIALERTKDSISLRDWKPPGESFMLVVGNEVYGICDEILKLCRQVMAIPVYGYKNSMNLSHALAITAYHIRQSLESRA